MCGLDFKVLTEIFSKTFINQLLDDRVNAMWKIHTLAHHLDLKKERPKSTLSQLFDLIYQKMIDEYRSEYVYKNAIAEKIVKGKHKLSKNCFYDTEFRVFDSIADVVISNGTTTAYEIKTEYDSFVRLENQLESYSKAFDKIYVVIPESKYESWERQIPASCGVVTLSNNYTLKTKRESKSNINLFDKKIIFSCLRRDEYINIYEKGLRTKLLVKPVDVKNTCREYFLSLSNIEAHHVFNITLRKRSLERELFSLSSHIPNSLTSLVLTTSLSKRRKYMLAEMLEGGF